MDLINLWNDQGRPNYKRSAAGSTYSLRKFSRREPDYYDEDIIPAIIVDDREGRHMYDLNSASYNEAKIRQEERKLQHALAEAAQEGYSLRLRLQQFYKLAL